MYAHCSNRSTISYSKKNSRCSVRALYLRKSNHHPMLLKIFNRANATTSSFVLRVATDRAQSQSQSRTLSHHIRRISFCPIFINTATNAADDDQRKYSRFSAFPVRQWKLGEKKRKSLIRSIVITTASDTDADSTYNNSNSNSNRAAAAGGGGGGGGYPFNAIEKRWQREWEKNKTFKTATDFKSGLDETKPKFYALDMFPYPSGAGLHVGHPEGYTATDIIARYKRMKGYNVLHPMGWDAFGLPAEQYAIETGTHPRDTTKKNVNRFREQLQSLGFSYDWDREVATCDSTYYKWTQWIFLQLLEKDLAYQAEVPVNWCPALGTVLANEEVIDGLSERGNHPVIRKPMKQWMLKITEYADRLLEDLDELDWPESIKEMQRNWIGRSEGAQLKFSCSSSSSNDDNDFLEVYTTRPDTLYGATYLVVAPEHPMIDKLTTMEMKEKVEKYCKDAANKSDLERTELQKTKTGVFLGAYATHPLTGDKNIPIWVADYVLGSYGTGSIMAVPAHDQRDFEFAKTFDLPIIPVVSPPNKEDKKHDFDKEAYTGIGKMMNSFDCDGMSIDECAENVIEKLRKKNMGERKINYKLRDWLFARQRYWGEPFPVVYDDEFPDVAIPISESDLPLVLPQTDNFKPSGSGEGPLANVTEWVKTTVPGNPSRPATRETNTMPQWAGSCWYYLRFIDPTNENALIDKSFEKYWMPVDLYVGGAEHAVLHLLYARFWHKVLFDIGVVSTKEPFRKLVSQGMILGEVEYTGFVSENTGEFVSAGSKEAQNAIATKLDATKVTKKGDGYVLTENPLIKVNSRAFKMSKSRGNVINPDDVVSEYGADSLRLYEMFMGPLTDVKVWQTSGVSGCYRFLARAYRLFENEALVTNEKATEEQLRDTNKMIAKVTEATETLSFNVAIAAMMEFTNAATKWETKPRECLKPFALCLSPYAPHLSEELYAKILETTNETDYAKSNAYCEWPEANAKYLVEDTIEMGVQVNGKTRGSIKIAPDATEAVAMDLANNESSVQKMLDGKQIVKVIYKASKILNIVVK